MPQPRDRAYYTGRDTQELLTQYRSTEDRLERTETAEATMDEIFTLQEIAAVLVDRGVDLP